MIRTAFLFLAILLIGCQSNTAPAGDQTMKLPIVYSDDYNIRFYGIQDFHPFDTEKYEKIVTHLEQSIGITVSQYHQAVAVTEEELLLVHEQEYIDKMSKPKVAAKVSELGVLSMLTRGMIEKNLIRPVKLATGGSIIAGRLAIEHGWAINLGGGYHHAKSGQGEGFCFIADIDIMIEVLRNEGLIRSAMILDLDAHQGNGHESIHGPDSLVYIFDVYNKSIYPGETDLVPYIDYHFPIRPMMNDEPYLKILEDNLDKALAETLPDILIYNAGTDIFERDPLGNLSISKAGIMKRDSLVFQTAIERQIPIVMLPSGGYHADSGPIIGQSLAKIIPELLKDKTE